VRCRQWLEEHIGTDHGVTFSVSEIGIQEDDPNITAVWYASNLGVFADNGAELFTPWYWKIGMWEVLHLFSRYAKEYSVSSTSDLEEFVSAYSSINTDADSLTVILVNRSLSNNENVNVTLKNFSVDEGTYASLLLHNLPSGETFESHTSNALVSGTVNASSNSFSITLPALSVTAVLLPGEGEQSGLQINLNPFGDITTITFNLDEPSEVTINLYDRLGRKVKTIFSGYLTAGIHQENLSTEGLASGVYFCELVARNQKETQKFMLLQ
jgi:hypothetical protein